MQSLKKGAIVPTNTNYASLIKRETSLYNDNSKIRSPFERDYTRVLHSTAYRRLKHKTQVFYNVDSDHICTRMEHVLHVESVSYTIAKKLGLNEELTKAIAIAHDLGHAPFGHHGEQIISDIAKEHLNESFWHEKNGLYFADFIELLPNHENKYQNLNLTYAVRDGIISHCGEVDNCAVKPRTELIDLQKDFCTAGKFNPITLEGCVVKLADKIAYVGRDIEDALNLRFLSQEDVLELKNIVKLKKGSAINTSTIIGEMIGDICKNSSLEKGICLSQVTGEKLSKIKKFNYQKIYSSKRFNAFKEYSKLIINQIFNTLLEFYSGKDTLKNLKQNQNLYPTLIKEFYYYLCKYVNAEILLKEDKKYFKDYINIKIYQNLQNKQIYIKAILDYISGMTDRYAVDTFSELIKY